VTERDDQGAATPPATSSSHGRRHGLEVFAGLSEMTVRPLSDPGAAGRVAPFGGAAVIALVLMLLPPNAANPSLLTAAAVLMAIVIAAALLVPWRRLPAWCQASIPLSFFIVVALLREAGGGAISGFSPLVLLPILWLAIYGSRTQFRLGIAATAATFIAPQILVGPPLYPATGWRGAVLWVAIGLLAGSAIQQLVEQSRHRSADVAALGVITRALMAGSDPRPALCDAAQLVTGAAFTLLFEPHPDGTLVATAGTEGVNLGLRVDPSSRDCATAKAWRNGTKIFIADAASDPHSSALTEHTQARQHQRIRRGLGYRRDRHRVEIEALAGAECVDPADADLGERRGTEERQRSGIARQVERGLVIDAAREAELHGEATVKAARNSLWGRDMEYPPLDRQVAARPSWPATA